MWSFQGSAAIGNSIFLFHAPNLLSVPIFVENRTFLNVFYCSYFSFLLFTLFVAGRRDYHFRIRRWEVVKGDEDLRRHGLLLTSYLATVAVWQWGVIIVPDPTTNVIDIISLY